MTEKKISLLGCGWLGLPLAKALLKSGYLVNGSTTTPAKLSALSEVGIQPFLIDLGNETDAATVQEFVKDAAYLIISVPPRIRSGEGALYPVMLQKFLDLLPKNRPEKAIFISSTSVYPDLNKVVTEADTPADPAGNYLLQAETLVQDFFGNQATIIRFCGLMGPSRQPGRFLAGKTNVANADAPVNMIHLDDCIAIIAEILKQGSFGDVFNACADLHPSRKAFFTKAALQAGLEPPVFSEEAAINFKQISSEKLKARLSYTFIHPDPMTLV